MEYYSVITKNEFESVLVRWMSLESLIHSEISQKEKQQVSDINAYIYMDSRKMVLTNLSEGQE